MEEMRSAVRLARGAMRRLMCSHEARPTCLSCATDSGLEAQDHDAYTLLTWREVRCGLVSCLLGPGGPRSG